MHLRTAVAALITGLALALVAVPAGAATAAAPVIISPANGGTLPAGSTGPLVIDFPVAGQYYISVLCGDYDYYWSNGIYGTYPAGPQQIAIDPLGGVFDEDLSGKSCTVKASSGNYAAPGTSTAVFSIQAPPLTLGDVSATKDTFYPLVRDGYLDETELRFRVNRNTDATLTVADSSGRTVYKESDWLNDGAGTYRWPWKGRTTSGKPVQPGKYRATIAATADGVTLSTSTTVKVVTKSVVRRTTLRRDYLSSHDSTRGNCYTSFSEYDETTTLDCWGGAFAATTFTFKIPANATIVSWYAASWRTGLDNCCRGAITKRGYRVGRTTFRVRVQVTGWRAVEVGGAGLTYRARIQI